MLLRKVSHFLYSRKFGERVIALLVGLILGISLILLALRGFNFREVLFFVAAIFVVLTAIVMWDLKRFLLIFVVIDISLNIDVLVGKTTIGRGSTIDGFSISLIVLALVVLYGLWFLEGTFLSKEKSFSFRSRGPIEVMSVFFLFTTLFSLLHTTDLILSLYMIWIYLFCFLLYFYISHHANTPYLLEYILLLLLGGLLFQVLVMELQMMDLIGHSYTGTDRRVPGTLGHPNLAGGYLIQAISILYVCLYLKIDRYKKLMIVILLFISVHSLIVGTQSRGSIIAFFISFVVMTILAFWKHWLTLRSLVGGLIVLLLIIPFFVEPIVTRFTEDDQGAADARGPLNEIAWSMVEQNPITGVGVNNFKLVIDNFIEPEQFGKYINTVHNGWMLIWSETGTLGFLAYCGLMCVFVLRTFNLIRRGHPRYSVIALGVLGSTVAIMIYMLVEIFIRRHLISFVWLNIGLVEAMIYLERQDRNHLSNKL